jgi:integrase
MAKVKLTDRFCATIKAAEQTDYFDEDTKGLALRVSAKAKTWTYHFTRSAKRGRVTLGSYPATSLAAARGLAIEARGNLERGEDPKPVRGTLKEIAERYLTREADLRSIDQRRDIFERLVYPALGDRPIDDIRRGDIVRLLDDIADGSGPRMADYSLAVLRRLFNWHSVREESFRSPIVRGMARLKPSEQTRDRTLEDDELRSVWHTAEGRGSYGLYLRFVLLTACRRNEAAMMPWAEITNDGWLIPAARYKNKRAHLVPLSTAAQAVLAKVPKTGDLVFTPPDRKKGWSHWTELEFRKACGVNGWSIHDLRRTARTLMSRAGVPTDHAERALGHSKGGIRGVYDWHEYHEEKRLAFEALASLIERIVNPQPNVVPMRGAANAE